eukprot:1295229-Prymnesium_polylepis.1
MSRHLRKPQLAARTLAARCRCLQPAPQSQSAHQVLPLATAQLASLARGVPAAHTPYELPST